MFALPGLYERAIAEAAKRRFAGDLNAEAALRAFWVGYIDALVSIFPSCSTHHGSLGRKHAPEGWGSGEDSVHTRIKERPKLRRSLGAVYSVLGTQSFFWPRRERDL